MGHLRSRLSVSTREQPTESWKNCISEQKMPSNPYKVVCDDSSTIAKYLRITVTGEKNPLYLREVEVLGYFLPGEYGYLLYKPVSIMEIH